MVQGFVLVVSSTAISLYLASITDLIRLEQFALTEASYTTIRLIQEFKSLESRDSGPWEEWLALTCAVNGAKVALTPA